MLSTLLLALVVSGTPLESVIPEGTVLRVVLNEKISTKMLQENDPVLFSLADDIRAGGRRGPVLIPRGSSVVARVAKLDRAGHLIGRSNIDLRVEEIVTGDQVFDGLSTKIVEIGEIKGSKGEVKIDGEIDGPVHRKRDAFLLLFPPTTIFQLMATPARGPDVVLPVETKLFVKLMSPIYVEHQVAETEPAPVLSAPKPVLQGASVNSEMYNVDELVSPVAFCPDTVLRYVFDASTHPLEVYQASQWMQQPRSGTPPRWDASIQALVGYPDLFRRLANDIEWTERLGNVYRVRPNDVKDAVQRIRAQPRVVASCASSTFQQR